MPEALMFPVLIPKDRAWRDYPAGTRAHSFSGGSWLKLPNGGWQWGGGTRCVGGTFPTPGADAIGACIEMPAGTKPNVQIQHPGQEGS